MDGASVAANEQFAAWAAARDRVTEQLRQAADGLREQADQLARGNRAQRRKAAIAFRKISQFEAWFQAEIRRIFDRATKGYNPEVGIFDAVQREASAKLAAIFQ